MVNNLGQILLVPSGGSMSGSYLALTGGTLTGALTITPSADGTSVFNVTTNGGTAVLSVDTTNQRVGINNSSPTVALDVIGTLRSGSDSTHYFQFRHDGSNPYIEWAGGNQLLLNAGSTGNKNIIPISDNSYSLGGLNHRFSLIQSVVYKTAKGSASAPGYNFDDGAGNAMNAGVFAGGAFGASWVALAANGVEGMRIDTTGFVGINKTVPGSQLEVDASSATTKGLIVKGFASQSANLQEWQKSDGTLYAGVDKIGRFILATNAGTPGDTPTTGTMVYDTTNHAIKIYDGGWKSVALS